MALMTQPEAESVLGPHLNAVFIEPWLSAVERWRSFLANDPEAALPLEATARANMIHSWGTHEARKAIEGIDGVREVSALRFFAITVGCDPLVRFKYIKRGRPSNVATEQQKDLRRHQYQDEAMAALVLEGIPTPPTLLTCGYTLDLTESEIRRVEIRCDYGLSAYWRWIVWGDSAEGLGGATVIEPKPLPTMPAPTAARVRSARPQKDAERQEAE